MAHRRRDLVEITNIVQQQEARWADDGISEGSMDSLDRKILGIPPLESQSRPAVRSRTSGLSNMLREKPASMTHKDWMATLLAQRQAQVEGLAACLRGDDGSRAGSSVHSSAEDINPALAPNPYLEPKFENIQRRMREGLAAIKNNNHRVEELSARSPSPIKRQQHAAATPPRHARPMQAQRNLAEDNQEELETMDDIKRSLDRRRADLNHRALSPTPSQTRPSRKPYNPRFGRADTQAEREVSAPVQQNPRAPQVSRPEVREELDGEHKEATVGMKELRALSRLLHKRPAPETAEWEAMLDRTSRSSDSLPLASAAIDVAELQLDAANELNEAHAPPIDTRDKQNATKDPKGKGRALDAHQEANTAEEVEVVPKRDMDALKANGEHQRPLREKATNTFLKKIDVFGTNLTKELVVSQPKEKKNVKDEAKPVNEDASRVETKSSLEKEARQPVKAEVELDDSFMDKTLEQFAAARDVKPAPTKVKPSHRKSSTTTISQPAPTESAASDADAYRVSVSVNLPTRSRFLALFGRPNRSNRTGFTLTWFGTLLALLLSLLAWYLLETLVHSLIGKPAYVVPGQEWDVHAPIWGDALPTLLERYLGSQIGLVARLPKTVLVEWPRVVGESAYEWAIRQSFSEMEREAMRLGVPIAALYRSEIAGVGEFSMSMDEEIWVNE